MADLSKLSDQELEALYHQAAQEGIKAGYIPAPPDNAPAFTAHNIVFGGLKGLDYQRGAAQRALLEATGQSDLLTPEEKAGALDPTKLQTAPGYGDLLERKFGDFPGSQTIGFGLDVLGDPLTWETGGISSIASLVKSVPGAAEKLALLAKTTAKAPAAETLAKIGQAMGRAGSAVGEKVQSIPGIGDAMSWVGEKIYKAPFKGADEVAIQKGAKVLPSELLLETGKAGSASEMNAVKNQLMKDIGESYKGIDSLADRAGASVDVNSAFKKAEEIISKERGRGFVSEADKAQEILDELKGLSQEGVVPFSQARGFREVLGTHSKAADKQAMGKAKQILEKARSGLGDELDKAAEVVSKSAPAGTPESSLAKAFSDTDQKYHALSAGSKEVARNARTEARLKKWTAVDTMLLGGAGLYGLANPQSQGAGVAPLAAKKLYDVFGKTTGSKTKIGLALKLLGESGLVGPAASQMTRQIAEPKSPWTLLNKGDENGQ